MGFDIRLEIDKVIIDIPNFYVLFLGLLNFSTPNSKMYFLFQFHTSL